ncbi:IS982 family transposase [Thiothrix nivea]|uniref:Transposase IS4 family protein n=1 Tax=Thiothrix nivea (strain ATCC 35100 / DSM 5205 / JP2) TaxID=870187 RepID=A0A656HLF1_THINJ|nr:IS982 family transposase [Thiothrix nivea]EIJ34975.1 transposase IS4 family protein [Thiothrix nivea DSM 5205]EIJ36027.1 transposase IS4 family protein [Thiothrix nivea DSM 5205]EIJ36346.1 transposase IS4 family protein [Thiothrix nivea DSM 5205]EIJ36425.1 transposase IS4 family protein [Thiothrix nivea DSM 5205]
MEDSLLELFCDIDDFCQQFVPEWNRRQLASGERQRQRTQQLALSEIMTILVYFHRSSYRCFKHYYLYQRDKLHSAFPELVSYSRFVYLTPTALIPLCVYLMGRRGEQTGISFVDATSIAVCHNRRIHSHKVFKKVAKRGKTSTGWFYGFKLHLVINDRGELLAFQITPANTDDRAPVPKLARGLVGKLFGDKGYISKKLFETLMEQGLQLITRVRKNMKNQLLPLEDKLLLRKRALIETVNDQLKNISQIEHTRHRSIANFMVNLICGLIAYTWQPKKPSLKWAMEEVMLTA